MYIHAHLCIVSDVFANRFVIEHAVYPPILTLKRGCPRRVKECDVNKENNLI